MESVPINYSTSAPTFYNVSPEEKNVIEQDVQAEIKLDKSIHEQYDLLETEMRVEPNFTEETRYPVNQHIVEIVIETLTAMGIQDPEELLAEWSSHCFYGMANFWEACQEYN